MPTTATPTSSSPKHSTKPSLYYGNTVDVKSGAATIIARIKICKSTNHTYSLSDLGEAFILGDTAAFISILGDAKIITADKKKVEYLFRKLGQRHWTHEHD